MSAEMQTPEMDPPKIWTTCYLNVTWLVCLDTVLHPNSACKFILTLMCQNELEFARYTFQGQLA